MQFVNLTPHTINIVDADGNAVRDIPASGDIARVADNFVGVDCIDGIPITVATFGDVSGLPAPADGTMFIVSAMVAKAVPNRSDVLIPSQSVRDGNGRIVGCMSLSRI